MQAPPRALRLPTPAVAGEHPVATAPTANFVVVRRCWGLERRADLPCGDFDPVDPREKGVGLDLGRPAVSADSVVGFSSKELAARNLISDCVRREGGEQIGCEPSRVDLGCLLSTLSSKES